MPRVWNTVKNCSGIATTLVPALEENSLRISPLFGWTHLGLRKLPSFALSLMDTCQTFFSRRVPGSFYRCVIFRCCARRQHLASCGLALAALTLASAPGWSDTSVSKVTHLMPMQPILIRMSSRLMRLCASPIRDCEHASLFSRSVLMCLEVPDIRYAM